MHRCLCVRELFQQVMAPFAQAVAQETCLWLLSILVSFAALPSPSIHLLLLRSTRSTLSWRLMTRPSSCDGITASAMPPSRILCLLALNGEIPKKLAQIQPPRCAGCLLGAMTKAVWRGKEQKAQHYVFTTTKPGECVDVDHLQSTEPGFFGQAKGRLTKTCYKNATVFVDHFLRLQCVHHMTINLALSETLEAKSAFECFAVEHGVEIPHYHCNNGKLADAACIQSCKESRQKLTFCGVNAHFQNGIAEQAIRDLSKSVQKQLFHPKQCFAPGGQHRPVALCSSLCRLS
jgi:hypothetical protein